MGKLDKYIKGDYSFGKNSTKKMPGIVKRIAFKEELPSIDELGLNILGHPGIYSWADVFFMTDLHIIGFGLDFAELDIWWLLNRRIRLNKDYDNPVKNKIYYYVTDPITTINGQMMQKLQLLKEYDVQIIFHNNTHELENGSPDFRSIYESQIARLKSTVSSPRR